MNNETWATEYEEQQALLQTYGSFVRRHLEEPKILIAESAWKEARDAAGPENVEIWWLLYRREMLDKHEERLASARIGGFLVGFFVAAVIAFFAR